jgi:hypothetical protein
MSKTAVTRSRQREHELVGGTTTGNRGPTSLAMAAASRAERCKSSTGARRWSPAAARDGAVLKAASQIAG